MAPLGACGSSFSFAQKLGCAFQLIVSALNARLERKRLFDRRRQTPSLEIGSVPSEVRRDGHDHAIPESDFKRARRHQPACRRGPDERCQFVLGCKGCHHFGCACRVLVHQQRYLTVMTLGAQGFGEDSHRTARESELHNQRQHLQLRRWNAIELWKPLLVVTLLGELASDTVANAAAVWGPYLAMAVYTTIFVPCDHCKRAVWMVLPCAPGVLPVEMVRTLLLTGRPPDHLGLAVALKLSVDGALLLGWLARRGEPGRTVTLGMALAGGSLAAVGLLAAIRS